MYLHPTYINLHRKHTIIFDIYQNLIKRLGGEFRWHFATVISHVSFDIVAGDLILRFLHNVQVDITCHLFTWAFVVCCLLWWELFSERD